jgi:iron complex transport system substrate-binding protein
MRSLSFARTIAGAAILWSLWPAPAMAAAQRIVSLNLCTDELLLRLAAPEQIGSVTWLARSPSGSNVAGLAERVPINHGLAEQVIVANPDLVLAGTFSARVAVALLKRTPLKLVEFDVPRNFDQVRKQIRDVAALVGQEQKGEQLVQNLDTRIARVEARPPRRKPTAIVFNPNGFTVGRGTLVDQVISAAGLDNAAARLGMENYGQVPLEVLAMNAIDVLIVSESRDGPPAIATEILRHPVLGKLPSTRVVPMPGRLWSCAGPALAEAVERLHAVALEIAGEGDRR